MSCPGSLSFTLTFSGYASSNAPGFADPSSISTTLPFSSLGTNEYPELPSQTTSELIVLAARLLRVSLRSAPGFVEAVVNS